MDPISAFKAQGQEGIRVREQYLPSMTADLRQEKQERTAGRWRQQGSKRREKGYAEREERPTSTGIL